MKLGRGDTEKESGENETFDAVSEEPAVEIQQQAERQSGEFQIGEHLGLKKRIVALDAF